MYRYKEQEGQSRGKGFEELLQQKEREMGGTENGNKERRNHRD
jgi:hypothetical protein